jgi:hypothetical protein
MRLEGLGQLKNPVTLSRIEHASTDYATACLRVFRLTILLASIYATNKFYVRKDIRSLVVSNDSFQFPDDAVTHRLFATPRVIL